MWIKGLSTCLSFWLWRWSTVAWTPSCVLIYKEFSSVSASHPLCGASFTRWALALGMATGAVWSRLPGSVFQTRVPTAPASPDLLWAGCLSPEGHLKMACMCYCAIPASPGKATRGAASLAVDSHVTDCSMCRQQHTWWVVSVWAGTAEAGFDPACFRCLNGELSLSSMKFACLG